MSGLLAEHGTPLAQARTRPFDVVTREEYVAARVWIFVFSGIQEQLMLLFINSSYAPTPEFYSARRPTISKQSQMKRMSFTSSATLPLPRMSCIDDSTVLIPV